MNNDVELEGRPRPLSAGLWTLFSWLRREDRSDSNDSISSAGSDRTVASFAFLKPALYQPRNTPFVLPPPGPPTDSYKKRLHDRNLRRQYDRDLTLHRKYGLFKSGEAACGYDAFSLPPVRRVNNDSNSRWDRERRATSECFQRRLAHVPGKRRAPLPPVHTISSAPQTTLTRRSTRKRRAPQPPIKVVEKDKENIKEVVVKSTVTTMNPNIVNEKQKLHANDVAIGCKSEKYSKNEGCSKDTKIKSEKSFLKHIFDSKKRSSVIDISSIKLLPSISELDKQAAEIIENSKLHASEHNNDVNSILANISTQRTCKLETWICVTCLKKYSSSTITCLYCLSKQEINSRDKKGNEFLEPSLLKGSNSGTQTEMHLPKTSSSTRSTSEEKQKLKDMLKEMKDSLPKRTKQESTNTNKINADVVLAGSSVSHSIETPTLRVGSAPENINKTTITNMVPKSNVPSLLNNENISPTTSNLASTSVEAATSYLGRRHQNISTTTADKPLTEVQKTKYAFLEQNKEKNDLHTPLKISSLFNPVYIPKIETNKIQTSNVVQVDLNTDKKAMQGSHRVFPRIVNLNSTSDITNKSINLIKPLPVKVTKDKPEPEIEKKEINIEKHVETQKGNLPKLRIDKTSEIKPTTSSPIAQNVKKATQDQHTRRRDLIHQLEQSIAKGDELGAATAASKLAQLRLSCSVLSFSSQILTGPSTSSTNASVEQMKTPPKTKSSDENIKIDTQTDAQKSSASNITPRTNFLKADESSTSSAVTKPSQDITKNKGQCQEKKEIIVKDKKEKQISNDMTTISVLVEDREATRGPVQLRIRRLALMRDLRREAELSLGVPSNLQRWIVGRVLCVNDNIPIITLAGPDFSSPFYLCVVESETKSNSTNIQTKTDDKADTEKVNVTNEAGNVYTELVQLEQQALIHNADNFECGICIEEYPPGDGVVLRDCVHTFCKHCLIDVVRYCEEPDIPCPAMGCRGQLQEREIRALVTPQDYERWLARGLAAAESGTRNAFHCRTRDCKGWALCEPGVRRFPCPVCKHINCVPCQAIHKGETCVEYRAKLKSAAESKAKATEAEDGTRTLLNSLIAKGEALECPECKAIITKKWGCDWVKCSACKTEICWVTRGRRWGPGGKGDTSGGCRCGIDGKRCHPTCGYCH